MCSLVSLPKKKFALACLAVASLASLHADDITQIANSANGWNDAAYWGEAAASGNNYFAAASGGLTNLFITDGITWSVGAVGTVRDSPAPGATSTFAGDSLTLTANTIVLGKVQNGNTSTANLIFGGGSIYHAPNLPGTATLAGTISFASGIDLGAIAMNPNGTVTPTTLTINSTILGDSSDTLQLTLTSQSGGNRLGRLILSGDISGFGGTIYVGTAVSGTNVNSFYSIQSSSVSATLNLDTNSNNFHYDLASNETFGSLIVGGNTLEAGTYDFTALNAIAGGEFFSGAGSITVVPEPSTTALAGLGLFALLIGCARRRTA